MHPMKNPRKAGFSLLQLSILLTVGGLALAATLPGGGAGDDLAKTAITLERMQKIEEATKHFMAKNQRRPYPADLTVSFDSSSYGVELSVPTNYNILVSPVSTHFTQSKGPVTFNTTQGSNSLTSGTTGGIMKDWLVSGPGVYSVEDAKSWVASIDSSTILTMNKSSAYPGTGSGLNYNFRNPVVAGGVPTKSLGLPDEYGIDGFGRRIIYVLDSRTATSEGCRQLQDYKLSGNVHLYSDAYGAAITGAAASSGKIQLTVGSTTGLSDGDIVRVNNVAGTTEANGTWVAKVDDATHITLLNSTFTNSYTSGGYVIAATGNYDHAMWALLSHGRDGQGASGMQGTSLDNRIKSGNTDAATLNNAFYDNTQATSFTATGLVNKATTSTFDDIVWVAPDSAHTCALGTDSKSTQDFRINGAGTAGNTSAAFGDVNGDGFQDIILGIAQQNTVRVLFGKKSGWAKPDSAEEQTLTGNNGFVIERGSATMTGFGTRIAVSDVNGDGYMDIIAGGVPTSTSAPAYAIIFGGRSWPATYTIGTSTLPASAVLISGMTTTTTSDISVGDVNSDGYSDIALPFSDTAEVYANFDGTDDYVDIGTHASLSLTTGPLTLSAWIKPDGDYTSNQTIIANGTGTSNYGLTFGYTNNKIEFWNWGGGPTVTSTTSVTSDIWYHIVAVRTGSTGAWNNKLYINGSLEVDSVVASNPNGSSPVPTAIGRFGSFSSMYFKGMISDVRIYNTALDASNVTYLYTRGASGSDPTSANLIGHWKLDERSGTTINDSSSGAHNGTATNVTLAQFWQVLNGKIGLLLGKASGWANVKLSNTYLQGNATDGFRFGIGSPNSTNGEITYGTDSGADGFRMSAICNVNGDQYDDLIIPGAGTSYYQRLYMLRGASQTTWSAAASGGMLDPSTYAGSTMLRFPTVAAATTPTYDINGIACKDINGDGRDDVIAYLKNNSTSQEYLYVWFGESSPATQDLDNVANYDIRFDLTDSAPSWMDATSIPQILLADVNNDGRNDIILSRMGDDPYFSISGTTFSINSTATGTQRSGAGTAYTLFQPTSWGTTPGLNKTFFKVTDYSFDGTDGFKMTGATANDAMLVMAASDMNKDNKTDILIGSGVNPTGGYFLFGKSAWPASYDLNCTRDTSGAHCATQITAQ